ncbi:LysR family transcriptional regulator [Candidatus Enterococcus mansonii]|uniref:HTH lysR-type domain-containing protein n=1 Tax=Candidatus Enterococcus mansonii TaxID=1834181 RepID=A0A242CJF1_9ENTE|nr:LysR family transcriptional regulator [Enterococcus sp. 4G2_DIV0659]OTO09912.1 hypothetical protein A5880_000595 [Enterococcus sp. 4G2_DIV0659]
MQIDDIKIFYEIARFNSTIKAANKLGYVQSNISKRIAKLEIELGKKLFYRTNKGMTLTTDGERFLPYAEKILSTVADIEKNFSLRQNEVRIGATQTISKNYLQNYYFEDNISIFTSSSKELTQQLLDCTIDFMIVNKFIATPELKTIQTMKETISWTKAKKNTTDFLNNTIVVSRDTQCPYRIETLDYLKKNNLTDKSIVEVDTLDVILSVLEDNHAIAILPEKTISSTNHLQLINDIVCNPVFIYVYSLSGNKLTFPLDLPDLN